MGIMKRTRGIGRWLLAAIATATFAALGITPQIVIANQIYPDHFAQGSPVSKVLDTLIADRSIQLGAVYGFWKANTVGEDIVLYDPSDSADATELLRFNMLRQQERLEADRRRPPDLRVSQPRCAMPKVGAPVTAAWEQEEAALPPCRHPEDRGQAQTARRSGVRAPSASYRARAQAFRPERCVQRGTRG